MKIIPSSRKNRYIAGVIILLAAIALIVWLVSWLSAPSEIRDWYDLNAVRDNLRSHYILMNSIDFLTPGYEELASETANQGKGWQPIGTSGNPFTGTFDGQGYAIRYLSINRPDELGVGLFGEVGQEGVIKNIGVVVPTVNGGIVGGLVGANGGTVSNSYSASYSTGSVTGTGGVGGLVGSIVGTVRTGEATVTVRLPESIPDEPTIYTYGPETQREIIDDRTVEFTITEPIPENMALDIRIIFQDIEV